jgi:hypothetical protein
MRSSFGNRPLQWQMMELATIRVSTATGARQTAAAGKDEGAGANAWCRINCRRLAQV